MGSQATGATESGGSVSMGTLPEITSALCLAIARGEHSRLRGLALQAAAKMGGDRGARIQSAFASVLMGTGPELALKHWQPLVEPRHPWTPALVEAGLSSWLEEATYAEQLAAAGERIRPLLLVGETRCGKSSSAAGLASQLKTTCYRLNVADAVSSLMGESAQKMRTAFSEMNRPGVWVLDELDAVTGRRMIDGAAAQERAHTIGFLLTALEQLPPQALLIATTNLAENIDIAVRARFTELHWPKWHDLSDDERESFAASHGARCVHADSYSEAVQKCRERRVRSVIAKAQQKAAE